MNLREVVEDNNTPAGRMFDFSIQLLITLSVLAFTISTLPNLSPGFRRTLVVFEVVTVLIFTVEYVLRIVVARDKRGFIFSFYGLVDLLSILPFYLAVGFDLRFLRVLRLMRLFRTFKLFRYTRALETLRIAFVEIKNELVVFLCACALLLYLASVGIYLFEHDAQPEAFASVFHSMWWAVATLTTVGYGDVYPVTAGGRIFTTIILFLGLGVIAVPAGLLASALSKIVNTD